MSGSGLRISGLLLGFVYRVQEIWVHGASDFGFRVNGSELRVQGLEFGVWGSGSRVQDLGFRVCGSGSGNQGLGFRVRG